MAGSPKAAVPPRPRDGLLWERLQPGALDLGECPKSSRLKPLLQQRFVPGRAALAQLRHNRGPRRTKGSPACAFQSCLPSSSPPARSEEHTSELQSLMRISYAVFCLKKKKNRHHKHLIKITPKKNRQTEH